jgi:hypothetical protein
MQRKLRVQRNLALVLALFCTLIALALLATRVPTEAPALATAAGGASWEQGGGIANDVWARSIFEAFDSALDSATGFKQAEVKHVSSPTRSTCRAERASRRLIIPCRRKRLESMLDVPRFRLSIRAFMRAAPAFPERSESASEGIVITAGGLRYMAPAIITTRLIRETFNSSLPITLVVLAGEQPEGKLSQLFHSLDVDVTTLEEVYPGGSASLFGSFNAKLWTIAFAPYRHVLLLDADSHPVVNPQFLLRDTNFRLHGAVLWPCALRA